MQSILVSQQRRATGWRGLYLALASLLVGLSACPGSEEECESRGNDGTAVAGPLVGVDAGAVTTCRHFYGGSAAAAPDQCFALLGNCSDGSSYAFHCQGGACWCLRDAIVTDEVDVGQACPATPGGVAQVCGWDHRGRDAGAPASN